MRNFSFYNPTRIEFGKGKEGNIGKYISEYGVSKVLVVYGSERIKESGLFDKVAKSLADSGVTFEVLGGVQSNPILSKVYEGIEIAKSKGLEAVLAVGGGRCSIRRKPLLPERPTRAMFGISSPTRMYPIRH